MWGSSRRCRNEPHIAKTKRQEVAGPLSCVALEATATLACTVVTRQWITSSVAGSTEENSGVRRVSRDAHSYPKDTHAVPQRLANAIGIPLFRQLRNGSGLTRPAELIRVSYRTVES